MSPAIKDVDISCKSPPGMFTNIFSPVFTANVSAETCVVNPLDLSLKESEKENVRDDCSYLDTSNEASELVSFRQLYDDIIERFTGLCEEWEKKEVYLQESEQVNQEGVV